MVHSRLLDVAIREFGAKGLDGASTRGIAAAAGTAMSSITYHYGGKDGLYAAAVRHIDAAMAQKMAPVLDDERVPDAPAEARAAIRRLVDLLAARFLDDGDDQWSLFILREQMDPTPAFDTFYAGAIGRMGERLAALVRAATGAGDADARIAAVELFGQVVVWRVSRGMADRLLAGFPDAERREAVFRHIARNTDCILDRLSAAEQEPQ